MFCYNSQRSWGKGWCWKPLKAKHVCVDSWNWAKSNEIFSLHHKYEYIVYHCFKQFVCHSQMDWKIPGDLWPKIKPDSQGGYRVFHSLSHKGWVGNDLPEDSLSLISKTWKICVEIPLGMCGKDFQNSLRNPNKRKLCRWGKISFNTENQKIDTAHSNIQYSTAQHFKLQRICYLKC